MEGDQREVCPAELILDRLMFSMVDSAKLKCPSLGLLFRGSLLVTKMVPQESPLVCSVPVLNTVNSLAAT